MFVTSSKSRSDTVASSCRYRAVYVGTAEHQAVPGIPARDLTADEVEQYGGVTILRNALCWEFVSVEKEGLAATGGQAETKGDS